MQLRTIEATKHDETTPRRAAPRRAEKHSWQQRRARRRAAGTVVYRGGYPTVTVTVL